MKKNKALQTTIVILFFVGWIFYAFWYSNKLLKSHVLGEGQIVGYSSGGRGNANALDINFILNISGKKYKESSRYFTSELSVFDCRDHFVGKTFPVAYDPSDPNNAVIMIFPKVFSRFGYSFPDSLKWVLQYKK